MNKEDIDRFTRVEQQILDQGIPHRLNQLTDFPYKSLDELRGARQKREIAFGIDYNGKFLEIIGTKADNIMQKFWVSLPIIIIVADFVLAVVLKKWIIILGIPFTLIGFLSTSPYNPFKNVLLGLGGTMFAVFFILFNWTWTIIIGSMMFAQIFALTAREQYRMVVEERALQSEVFFCYMLKNKHILVKDTKTGKLFTPNGLV